MRDRFAQALLVLLLIVHAALVAIGIAGLIELFVPQPPWPRISNPLFPRWVLLIEWPLLLAAGIAFIVCYVRRSRALPWTMTLAYAAMGSLCAVQTFWFLEHETRFLDMAVEYIEYVLVLLFLYRSSYMQRRLHAGLDVPHLT